MLKVCGLSIFKQTELPFLSCIGSETFASEWKRIENSTFIIDLIFTNQPNLITESGVLPSLYPNSYHQIVFAIFNLKMFYIPLYELRHLTLLKSKYWSWEWSFANKDVNEKVILFNKIIVNILLIYISQETIFCGDRDLWWMKKKKKWNSWYKCSILTLLRYEKSA